MEQLYMIEVLVTKIVFAELPVPLKKDIVVQATCGTVANLEIRTDVMGALEILEAKERSSKRKDVDIDCGRSVVFPIEPPKMREVLENFPIEVTVYTKKDEQPLGVALIPWLPEFLDLVSTSEQSSGYVTPVCVEDSYDMTKGHNEFGGTIAIFIRLSSLGRNIYTNIQRCAPSKESSQGLQAPGATYLFKSVDNATIFKCTRHGVGSDADIMPVSHLYNMVTRPEQQQAPHPMGQPTRGKTKSTETLLTMKSVRASAMSMTPSVFLNVTPQDKDALRNTLLSSDSIQSIMSVSPLKGQRYLDLTELHTNVSMFSTFANAFGLDMFNYSNPSECEGEGEVAGMLPLIVDYKSLTVEEIERRLCKHPDCPAAKLFKNYGIGPLAKTIVGTGGLYKDVDPPCTYGLSHCNGTIENYGPLGRFRKPKAADQPFIPQSKCKCSRKKSSTTSTTSTGSNTKKMGSCYTHCPMARQEPLRLRGGAPDPPACDPLPNPLTLCQDLMDEFNKVLKDYKDALGPCGQATCPFAMNVIGDACQDICNATDPERLKNLCILSDPEAKLESKEEFTGCGVPNCPYKRAAITPVERDFSKYQSMPGCGYANCPFIRAKLGMEEDEDKHLPPFKDYQKQETYKYHDKLPPIHWDCPDPLPQGDCKNPDCPFVKRDALIKKYFPEPCCPCGSPACPYVCAPCTFPGCPFAIAEPCPPVCPYTEPPPKELKCTPSVCPFARKTEEKCENPNCPYRQYEERLEECAREMERLRAEEEAEDSAPCKPCGRSRTRSRTRSRSRSSRSPSTVRTSFKVSLEDSPPDTSQPCILAASAISDEEQKICQQGTCGTDKLTCAPCKEMRSKSKKKLNEKSHSTTHQSSSVLPSEKDIKETKELSFTAKPQQVSASRVSLPRSSKGSKIGSKASSRMKGRKKVVTPKKMVSIKEVAGNYPNPMRLCRKKQFRFDRNSYRPCTKIGHRECVLPKFLVPKDMGWLWNVHTDYCGLRPRRGWKPGAISKLIALRIDYFNSVREHRPRPAPSKSKIDLNLLKNHKPTVSVTKKDGVINVTMLPVKEPAEVKKRGDGNPYMDCSPLQFKITKNDLEKKKRFCFCGGEISDTTSSELDIEFSPPGGMINPRLISRTQPREHEAQYDINDVPIPPPPEPRKRDAAWGCIEVFPQTNPLCTFWRCVKKVFKTILPNSNESKRHWLTRFLCKTLWYNLPPLKEETIVPRYPGVGSTLFGSKIIMDILQHYINWKPTALGYDIRILLLDIKVIYKPIEIVTFTDECSMDRDYAGFAEEIDRQEILKIMQEQHQHINENDPVGSSSDTSPMIHNVTPHGSGVNGYYPIPVDNEVRPSELEPESVGWFWILVRCTKHFLFRIKNGLMSTYSKQQESSIPRLRGGCNLPENYGIYTHTINPVRRNLQYHWEPQDIPVLRLRGGGTDHYEDQENDQETDARLRGGGPVKIEPMRMPNPYTLCKDLLDDYDKLMSEYKKALGPCGTAICPLNYNVLEENCRQICRPNTCDEAYCPPPMGPCGTPLCPHLTQYSIAPEDFEEDFDPFRACYKSCKGPNKTTCKRPLCPFGKEDMECLDPKCKDHPECIYDLCTSEQLMGSEILFQSQDKIEKEIIRCNRHICPYEHEKPTVDDVLRPGGKKIKTRKGCGSPFCPHAAPKVEFEVSMPKFPCKRPCPSADELPPIHWDCPDPLPIGECSNPLCPLREKLPCGHCPISGNHCGFPGCPFAGDDICPPTCPYMQKNPPKDIECTPSVCPLARPHGYRRKSITERKQRICGDRCPYIKGNVLKKTCGNPKCPYRTCVDDESSEDVCSDPECPYKKEAMRQAQKKEQREKEAKTCELASKYTEHVSGSKSIEESMTIEESMEQHNEKDKEIPPRLSRPSSRKSGLIKMFKKSLMQMDEPEQSAPTDDVDECNELSCAAHDGEKLCRKCQRLKVYLASTSNKKIVPKKKAKKKKNWGYVYTKGTYYPGVKFGHKDCNINSERVPWDMGWLWNAQAYFTPPKGWKPGAIGRTILRAVNARRKKLGLPPRPMIRSPLPQMRRRSSEPDLVARYGRRSRTRQSQEQLLQPKPTLTVKKKDGVVYVTMNPLKDPSLMEDNEYPYIDCSPLEFRIIKKKNDDGFKKCGCSTGDVDLSSEKSSELDIEFTPPAGIVRPELMGNRHVCHTESQYDKEDIPKSEEEMEAKPKKKGKKGSKASGTDKKKKKKK